MKTIQDWALSHLEFPGGTLLCFSSFGLSPHLFEPQFSHLLFTLYEEEQSWLGTSQHLF